MVVVDPTNGDYGGKEALLPVPLVAVQKRELQHVYLAHWCLCSESVRTFKQQIQCT